MFHRLSLCLILVTCIFSTNTFAINAVVSNTVFYLPDSINQDKLLPYVESSWEIIPHTLRFKTTPEKAIYSKVKTDLVYTLNKNIVAEDHFIVTTPPRASIDEIDAHKILDLRRFFLPVGNIIMKIKFTDLNDTNNVFRFTDSFTVAEPPKAVFYSKLQLLDTIYESDKQTVFAKNGVEQIPLNGFFLDDKTRTLNFYAELYHTKTISPKEYPLTQKVYISKTEMGSPFQLFNQEDTISSQDVSLVSGTFKTPSLLSGNYYLNVTLENKYHSLLASNSLFFQRLNKHPSKEDTVRKLAADTSLEKINVLNLDKTFVSKFSLLQLKSILRMLLPVSDLPGSQTIKNFLDKPDEMYMRYYVYNHFLAIDPKNPGKAWKEFSDKVITVNKLFKTHGTQGYATERGFMYLRYGPPTEMIQVDNEMGTLPYEIWQYNVLSQLNHKDIANAIMLFYKPNPANDDYILLHTTVGGEAQNPSWRNLLYLNGNSNSSGNFRIEQYLGSGGR